MVPTNKPWDTIAGTTASFALPYNVYPTMSGFQFSTSCFGNKGDASQWSQSLCTGSTCTVGMAIGPSPDGHPQKIPATGRIKPRFLGHGYGYV